MYLQACAGLLFVGLILNRHDRRMLALTILVGTTIFIPVPRDTALQFYLFCIASETLAAIVAVTFIRARASEMVASVCVLLVLLHVMGYIKDGYPALSAYRILVPLLESLQLVTCILMSPALYARLRNRQP